MKDVVIVLALSFQCIHSFSITHLRSRQNVSQGSVRNVAIIAHVDHGKTTLVDSMLKRTEVYKASMGDRVMDSNDQERERGITILAKNFSLKWKNVKINLVDTPGHSDFGGEVERVMNLVDGVLLVVDSCEGPKPQTRYVLKKALDSGKQSILVVNKIDRPNCRANKVVEEVFDLFLDLGATEEQATFHTVFASGLTGVSGKSIDSVENNLDYLLDSVINYLPVPSNPVDASMKMMISHVQADTFKGKLALGRIEQGIVKAGDPIAISRPGSLPSLGKVDTVFVFDDLGRKSVPSALAGDIVMVSGLPDFNVGDTLTDTVNTDPLEPIKIDEPTVKILMMVNHSAYAGQDRLSTKLTSSKIQERIKTELTTDTALKVNFDIPGDAIEVSGRGQLHLSVLIENMRREGFEIMIGSPKVILKTIDGEVREPWEMVEMSVPQEYMGPCMTIMDLRKGEMVLYST
eukprot:GHVL01043243.1.p1 GENE.GHVL01043243.1~~GHVL01043243.1.p1  ORF type:complete len:461 (+),score=48.34 GHVL01043243.1:631-2013(+)